MILQDTLTRSQKEIRPIDGQTYRFYCCGPTVYGPAHIGNFRTFVLQDVFRRTLETGGTRTLHVRNLTDVDDKTIRGSQAAGKTLKAFTDPWRDKFHADCEALACLPPHIEPSAVEHIPQQIAMIETLITKGHAYASDDGSVYFKISSFPNYGKLSHLDERELDLGKTQNTRANSDEYEKDSISDFVLWKARREEDGENFWESPWGQGRPGWHLECSAMIAEYLGDSFDMHSGGSIWSSRITKMKSPRANALAAANSPLIGFTSPTCWSMAARCRNPSATCIPSQISKPKASRRWKSVTSSSARITASH